MEDFKKALTTALNTCPISSGPAARWRLSVETLSSREFATCPSTCSSSGPSTACCTINSSWRGSASTTHPPTRTSGTAEVQLVVSTPTSLSSSSSFFLFFPSLTLPLGHFSISGWHLWDSGPASRDHDEDGELPEASGAKKRSDRHR